MIIESSVQNERQIREDKDAYVTTYRAVSVILKIFESKSLNPPNRRTSDLLPHFKLFMGIYIRKSEVNGKVTQTFQKTGTEIAGQMNYKDADTEDMR